MRDAAAHADRLAGHRAAESLADIACDLQCAAVHSGTRERAGVAANGQSPSRHRAPGLDADLALDLKAPLRHSHSDAIETRAAVFDEDHVRIALMDVENVSHGHALARRSEFDPGDFRDCFTRQIFRD